MNSLIKILTYCYIFLALAGCQVDPLVNNKSLTANSSTFSYQGENKTGAGLLTILELQKNIQEKTLELLNKQDEILCDYAELHSGPFYGIYYLVPVRNKSNQQIEKAFVYKIIDETNQQTKAFKAVVSDIIVLEKQELNRIPAYQRFLYAYPFKKWEEQGLNVSTELSDFAKKTDKKWHRLATHELPASQSRTIASFITITYELHVNNEVGEDGTIYVYGISSHDADSILLSNQCIFESYLGETVTFDFDYRTVTIRLQGDDIVTHPNLEEAISEFMVANDISFGNTFPYYYAITWQITATSVDPPENTVNTSGGSSGGSNGNSGEDSQINQIANLSHYWGTDEYYLKRLEDFQRRYPNETPPSYYLNYGDFYLREFKYKTRDLLSEAGKIWVDRTLLYLQKLMEKILHENENIELRDELFLEEAFESHVKAYDSAGITNLSITDKVYIVLTVYPQDLFTARSIEQVKEIARKQLQKYIEDPSFGFEQAMELMQNWEFYKIQVATYLLTKQTMDPRTHSSNRSITNYSEAEWTVDEVMDLLFREMIEYFENEYGNDFYVPLNSNTI